VELVKDECELKNIDLTLKVDSQIIVNGNESQLEMVVLNLLNNAIDSLDTFDGKRSIVITSSQVDGTIELSVEDSGVGVSSELHERIFDLFRTTKNDGMGFGLWLSRAVMDNHRGGLFLDKNFSDGARFVLEFRSNVD
jgi:signal transduction histidine kinase